MVVVLSTQGDDPMTTRDENFDLKERLEGLAVLAAPAREHAIALRRMALSAEPADAARLQAAAHLLDAVHFRLKPPGRIPD